MTTRLNAEVAVQATAEIIVAFLQNASISPDELPGLVRRIRAAVEADLSGEEETAPAAEPASSGDGAAKTGAPSAPQKAPQKTPHANDTRAPAVPVAQSIHRDYLISLEDGAHYRSLRRHLMSKYGMTPDDYRAKWNLPADYPMVAPSYAEARSEVAKRTGLGRSPAKKRTRR
jgi:predicted transcriptional regulator